MKVQSITGFELFLFFHHKPKKKGNIQMKKITKLFLILLSVVAISACAPTKNAGKQVLRLAQAESATSLNYLLTSTSTNLNVVTNVAEGLLQYDETGKLTGALAKDWSVSEDGLTYTFNLRDATWDNGEKITAADFVYSYQTRLKEAKSVYRHYLAYLKNGADINAGTKDASELGVEAISDTQLKITLAEPRTFFADMLVFPAFFPLNETFVENVGVENYGTSVETFLANGPYTLSKFTPDEGWTYVKNEKYWDTAHVSLAEIDVRVVQQAQTQKILWDQGEIDVLTLTTDDIPEYQNDPQLHHTLNPRINYFYLSGSTQKPNPLLANKNLRAALAHSIDKSVIAESILNDGSIATDYFVPKNVLFNEGVDFRDATKDVAPIFDQTKAKAFYTQAAQELQLTGPISIDLAVSDVPVTKKIYENIKSQIETTLPDVTINLVTTPIATYFPMLYEHATPAAASQLEPAYKDIEGFLYIFRTGLSQNFSDWSNTEYDTLYKKAESLEFADNVKERWDIYHEMEQLLVDDYTIIPIYQTGTSYLIRENVVGYDLNATVPHVSYKRISIK